MRVALIGLGEVARVLAEDLRGTGVDAIACWDIAFADPASPASRNAAELDLRPSDASAAAVSGAELVICAVTAANAAAAAEAAAAGMNAGAWFLDVNSASPGQKQAAAALIERAGGRYVEAAVMAPIEPLRLAVPMLLGGPHARAFAELAASLGFTGVEVYADAVGPAAATKLCRSVVIKGVEALLTEAMLAARAWGVERRVLDSLSNLLPADDWEKLAGYLISRSLVHGARRAEEMTEAAATVAETGIAPVMAQATAERQGWAAAHRTAADAGDLAGMVDAVRAALPDPAAVDAGNAR